MVSTNKQGQAIGRKGMATRTRLMNSARHLLKTVSPMDLTAVSIAKQAKISSATFYMYFDDVKDMMLALSHAANADFTSSYDVLNEDWDVAEVQFDRALRFVKKFDAAWDRHREILRYRNLEADRGDLRFEEAKTQSYMPIIDKLAALILSAYPAGKGPKKGEAYAEAATLYAAMEGIAESDPDVVARGLGVKRLQYARARVMAHVLGDRGANDGWYPQKKLRRTSKTATKPVEILSETPAENPGGNLE